MQKYNIVRYYWESSKKPKIIRRGFTLEQARDWCSREDTHEVITKHRTGETLTLWFDGFVKQ